KETKQNNWFITKFILSGIISLCVWCSIIAIANHYGIISNVWSFGIGLSFPFGLVFILVSFADQVFTPFFIGIILCIVPVFLGLSEDSRYRSLRKNQIEMINKIEEGCKAKAFLLNSSYYMIGDK